MPKRLSVKDKKTIYCAYKIGEVKNIARYSDIFSIEGMFTTFNGEKTTDYYGVQLVYDAVIKLEYNENTKYINQFTKFWSGKPDSSDTTGHYSVVKISSVINGIFSVYLSSTTQNNDTIWYELDGEVYSVDAKFDKNKLILTIPSNMFLPIWYFTKVWYEEPEDVSTTDYGIHLVSIEEYETYTQFKFGEGLCLE